MTHLQRWKYHLRVIGLDALWIPLGAAFVFVWLVALGGEGIRRPATLTVWSEIVVPALAAFLMPFAASSVRDLNRALMCTRPVPSWRIYLERTLLLLAFDTLCSLGAGAVVIVTALPGEAFGLAVQAALAGVPVLLFFTGLALLASLALRSASGGAAASLGVWLFFLLNRHLVRNAVFAYAYPFMTTLAFSSPAWAWNRAILTVCGLGMLAAFAWQARNVGERSD